MARESRHHIYKRKANRGGYIEILYYVRFVDWKKKRRIFPAGTNYQIAKQIRDELWAKNTLGVDFDEMYKAIKRVMGLDAWLDDCIVSKATKPVARNYQMAAPKLKEFFNSKPITEITGEAVQDFKKWRYGQTTQYKQPPKPATVNRELSLLRFALRRALKLEKIAALPWIELDAENNKRNRVASNEELKLIYSHMPASVRAVVTVLCEQGMRISEGAGLLRSNVKLDENLIRLEASQTKNGKAREMPMTPITREIIKAALARKVQSVSDRVFLDDEGKQFDRHRVYKYFQRACRRAKITGLTPHDLRATFSTRKTIDEGWDRELVKAIMGDTTDKAFSGYVRPKMADLKKVME